MNSDNYTNFIANLGNFCLQYDVKISGDIVVEDFKFPDTNPVLVSLTDKTVAHDTRKHDASSF